MSRVCVICAKKPGFGQQPKPLDGRHQAPLRPNLQKMRILLDGSPTRAYVCTRCLKSGRVVKAV